MKSTERDDYETIKVNIFTKKYCKLNTAKQISKAMISSNKFVVLLNEREREREKRKAIELCICGSETES